MSQSNYLDSVFKEIFKDIPKETTLDNHDPAWVSDSALHRIEWNKAMDNEKKLNTNIMISILAKVHANRFFNGNCTVKRFKK